MMIMTTAKGYRYCESKYLCICQGRDGITVHCYKRHFRGSSTTRMSYKSRTSATTTTSTNMSVRQNRDDPSDAHYHVNVHKPSKITDTDADENLGRSEGFLIFVKKSNRLFSVAFRPENQKDLPSRVRTSLRRSLHQQ